MSNEPPTYSALSPEEQTELSVWIESFEERFPQEGGARLKQTLDDAPPRLRSALLPQLLPVLIDEHRKRQGVTPTLHELRLAHPDIASELSDAYPKMATSYQLPIELHGYRITQVVGDGGQAVVLRAQDDVHSTVAIKLSTSPQHNDLILRERQLLGECHHPGIISVIGSGMQDDRAYYVMPYLRGMTLADKYASHRPEASEVARLGAELCSIVDHLHREGILHRDIKPANVLVDEHGAVKLIDLGMAIERSRWGETLPAIQEFHGTPAFMSPEQAASDGQSNGELSDVFSIGATLYWLGTGSPPFDGGSGESVLSKAAACQYDQDQLQAVTNWPKPLLHACLAAMAADPVQRTASAADLADTLHDSTSRMTPLYIGKSKSIVAVVLLLLIAGLGVTSLPEGLNSFASTSPENEAGTELAIEKPTEAPAKPRWIDLVAETFDIDLAAIKAKDFQITARSLMRLVEPWGEQKRGSAAQPELAIQIPKNLLGIAKAIECRVGDHAWSKLRPTKEKSIFVLPLNPVAAGSRGPVELRIASELSGGTADAAGPFRYDIHVTQALLDDRNVFGTKLLEEAITTKVFEDTPTGWVIREEYSKRYTPLISNLAFRSEKNAPMTFAAVELNKLRDANPDAPDFQDKDVREYFRLVSQDIQASNRLWCKIYFHNGVSRGPFLTEKPLTESQKQKQRVEKWFKGLGDDVNVAKLDGSELSLTRLNEILPDLTHIHVQSESNYSFPEHVSREVRSKPETQKSYVTRRTSEQVFRVGDLPASRIIPVPIAWHKLFIRGRLADGSYTPTVNVYNSKSVCASPLLPVASSPEFSKLETYVYIGDDMIGRETNIVQFLSKPDGLSKHLLDKCQRTHLLLSSVLPEGAVKAEHFIDKEFSQPYRDLRPGVIYVRYVDNQGKPVGYTAYRLGEKEFRDWVDHAYGHAGGKGKP